MCWFPLVAIHLLFFVRLFLFPSCGFLPLGVLNWSTAQVSSVFEAFFVFFVLICGGEVRSLGEVGGLVPLRLLRTPSLTLHASVLVGD